MTFSGSKHINYLFEEIDPKHMQAKLNELAKILDVDLSQEALDFFLINPIKIKFNSLNNSLNIIKPFTESETALKDLSKYFAARELLEFSDPMYSIFGETTSYPDDYLPIAKKGANGLFQYGYNQFKVLKKSCDKIIEFVIRNKYNRAWLIESPLGNVIPVQVLNSLMLKAGIKSTVISLSLPRNEKPKLGFTINDIVIANKHLFEESNDVIIYPDDVISGSRFRKISSSFRKATNSTPSTFIPCAFVFNKLVTPENIRNPINDSDKKILRKRASEIYKQHNFDPWFEIPELPKIKIDSGLPIVYESPVVWGEQPIVAGMKKCNYVFNIIEQFESILSDIISNTNKSRDILLLLWSYDTNGVHYVISEEVILGVFTKINNSLNWEEIKSCAKDEYSLDYCGSIHELTPDEAFNRMNWVMDQITKRVEINIGKEQSNILHKALSDLFTVIEKYFPEDRDSNYCNYYLKYNKSIRRLNFELVELIQSIT